MRTVYCNTWHNNEFKKEKFSARGIILMLFGWLITCIKLCIFDGVTAGVANLFLVSPTIFKMNSTIVKQFLRSCLAKYW